jgi:hypothetical protein
LILICLIALGLFSFFATLSAHKPRIDGNVRRGNLA